VFTLNAFKIMLQQQKVQNKSRLIKRKENTKKCVCVFFFQKRLKYMGTIHSYNCNYCSSRHRGCIVFRVIILKNCSKWRNDQKHSKMNNGRETKYSSTALEIDEYAYLPQSNDRTDR